MKIFLLFCYMRCNTRMGTSWFPFPLHTARYAERGGQCRQHCHNNLNQRLPKFLVFHSFNNFLIIQGHGAFSLPPAPRIWRLIARFLLLLDLVLRQLLYLHALQELLHAVAGTVVRQLGGEHDVHALDVVGYRE